MDGLPTNEDALVVDVVGMSGFRGRDYTTLYASNFNVIVGANGAGKSTILQALAIGLSRLTSRIIHGRQGGIQISAVDISIGQPSALVAVIASLRSNRYSTSVIRARAGRTLPLVEDGDLLSHMSNGLTFSKLADFYRERLSMDDKASLPVIAFYPVNRAVIDIPVRIKGRHTFDQVAAYDGAFETQRNFRNFFEWFREREDLENEERIDHPNHRDPQLQTVRQAIENMMDGYLDLRVRRNPLRMTLKKGDLELMVNQLSDGEKALLSLVGDLARRLAIANPGLDEPLEGEGVVMIDEVDLHLHPSWQRRVVERLPAIFPNIQFFLTTHSPVVASAVKPEHLWVMRDGKIDHAEAYGQEVGLVLSEVFDTPPRLDLIRRQLDELFVAIHNRDLSDAQERLEKLSAVIGPSDPELVQARVMLAGYAAS